MGREARNTVQPLRYPDRPWQSLIQGSNTYFASTIFGIGDLAPDLGQGKSDLQALRVLYQQNFGAALLGRSAYFGENNSFHSSFDARARLFHFQDICHCAV